MKNIKFKISILLASLVVSLSSCEEYFAYDYPASDLPEWQTVGDLEYMLISCYDECFSEGGWSANVVGNSATYSVTASDYSLLHPVKSIDGFMSHNRENYPFDSSGKAPQPITPNCYESIRSANTLIAFIEQVRAGEIAMLSSLSTSEQAQLDRIDGEAHFMRAYSYWFMAQSFMPPYSVENRDVIYIPFLTEPVYTAEELLAPNMGTMGEVWDLMVSDLEEAKTCLEAAGTSDSDIQTVRFGFANKYAAAAMLMRFKFIMQDWDGADEEIDYILNSGLYDLSEQPIRAFNRDITIPSSYQYAKEVIFEAIYGGSGALADEPWAISRFIKIGQGNTKKTADIAGAQTDPNWCMGGRGDNWMHLAQAQLYWNPEILKIMGWAIADPDGTASYSIVLTDEGEGDLRCTQLNYFLYATGYSDDQTVSEQTIESTTWNALWCDKYFRSTQVAGTYLPLIRLPEVLLTQATIALSKGDTQTAVDNINAIRKRALAAEWETPGSYVPITTITEEEIEIERMKEMSFEFSDRFVYQSALKKSLGSSGKTKFVGSSVMGTEEVPEIAYPYSGFHMILGEEELDFSSTGWLASENY